MAFLWKAFAAARDHVAIVAPSLVGLVVLAAAVTPAVERWGAMGVPMAFTLHIAAAVLTQLVILAMRYRP
jgi:hypothetical protein